MKTADDIYQSFFDLYEHNSQNLYDKKLFAKIKSADLLFMQTLLKSMETYDEYEMNRAIFRADVQKVWSKNKNVVCELLLKIFKINA